MRPYGWSARLAFCAIVVGLAVWGQHSSVVRRVIAYGTGMLVMLYVCSLASVLLFGWIPAKGYLAIGLSFLGGAIIGLVAGVAVGRFAVDNATVYWLLVLMVAGVITWLPSLM